MDTYQEDSYGERIAGVYDDWYAEYGVRCPLPAASRLVGARPGQGGAAGDPKTHRPCCTIGVGFPDVDRVIVGADSVSSPSFRRLCSPRLRSGQAGQAR
jgi:hypothetical protein